MIKYKIDVIAALTAAGYPPKRLREQKILPEATLTRIRRGCNINTETLNKICIMLRKQPGDILTVEATDDEKLMYF